MGSLVEGIWIRNRAPALSLPINAATLAGAANVASHVVSKLADAVGFDEILQDQPSDAASAGAAQHDGQTEADASAPPFGPAHWLDQIVDAIRQRLSHAGVPADAALELDAQPDGRLRVDGDHPKAAAIEATLSADDGLRQRVAQYIQAGGATKISLGSNRNNDLTKFPVAGNIQDRVGGYANW